MKRLATLSTLLLVALSFATGCKSHDAKTMSNVPPPAQTGPPIASTNTNLYDTPRSSIPPVAPLDNAPVPALPAVQQNTGNVTLAAPPTTSLSSSSYTVQRGDTLWRIASNKYGSGQKWRDIVAANPGLSPEKMRVGQTINLP